MKKNLHTYKKYNKKMNPNVENNKEEELKDKVSEETAQEAAEAQATQPEAEATDEQAETQEQTADVEVADEWERKLKEAEEKATELNDRYLRLSAEFDNYRKRTLKEKADLILNGSEKALTSILPIVDDMERAKQTMDNATDVAAVRKGVALIYNKFMQTLEQNGVKPIVTEGQALDTDFHEAIAVIEAPSEELKGKVLDCVQRGYTLNDKVIRHAKVVIGK